MCILHQHLHDGRVSDTLESSVGSAPLQVHFGGFDQICLHNQCWSVDRLIDIKMFVGIMNLNLGNMNVLPSDLWRRRISCSRNSLAYPTSVSSGFRTVHALSLHKRRVSTCILICTNLMNVMCDLRCWRMSGLLKLNLRRCCARNLLDVAVLIALLHVNLRGTNIALNEVFRRVVSDLRIDNGSVHSTDFTDALVSNLRVVLCKHDSRLNGLFHDNLLRMLVGEMRGHLVLGDFPLIVCGLDDVVAIRMTWLDVQCVTGTYTLATSREENRVSPVALPAPLMRAVAANAAAIVAITVWPFRTTRAATAEGEAWMFRRILRP